MNFIKKNSYTVILVVMFMIGLCLILYPSVADYWNQFHQSRAIANYEQILANADTSKYDEMKESALAYNEYLTKKGYQSLELSDTDREKYNKELDLTGTGIMGYIVIQKINVKLPIYHGTDDAALQIAVGHIEGTSLPVGGTSSHCVLSGHRGLPSAKLFTRLDEMEEGDIFEIHTLNDVYYYQIDQIKVVEPTEVEDLMIVEGEDLCTLVTCTPYGVNSHRLLVRGTRLDNYTGGVINVTSDGRQIERELVAVAVAVPILLGLLIYLLIITRKGARK